MKLKPCPFCGGKCCVCSDPIDHWMAHCQDCDCCISADKENNFFYTQQSAAEAWNTRPSEEAAVRQTKEACREAIKGCPVSSVTLGQKEVLESDALSAIDRVEVE